MSNIQKAVQFKNLGNEAFKAKNYEEAIKHFTQAIQNNPEDHVLYSNRSGSYLNAGNHQKALQDAITCINMKPDWARGYQRKGTALFYMDKLDEAIETYNAGLKVDPSNQALKDDLKAAENKKHKPQGPPPEMNQAYLQAMMKLLQDQETKHYIQDPQFMQKVQLCMQNPQMIPILMQQDPKLKKAFEVISSAANDFNFQDMMKNMEGAGTPPPPKPPKEQPKPKPKPEKMDVEDPAEIVKNKGNAAFKKKQFQQAINCYDQAIKLKPQEPLYYSNKAAVYIETKEYQKALEQIAEAEKLFQQGKIKDFAKKAKVLARKASIYAHLQKYDEAFTLYDKSLVEDHNQKVKDDYNQLKKLKKQKQAREYINPEIAEKNCQTGNTLFKEGKFPDALKQYEQAIRRNPEVAKYYSNLGTVYIKLMEFQRARDYFEIAIKKDPSFVKAYSKKGDCHFFLKEYHKARQSYQAGLKHDPNNENCKQGIQKTQAAIYTSSSKEDQEERAKKAMADPQIQAILQTPEVRNALAELQRNPKALSTILQDKHISQKLERLIAAGILRIG